jgi:hypothetical protein
MRRATLLLVVVVVVTIGVLVTFHFATRAEAQDGAQPAMVGHPLVGTWIVDDAADPMDAPSLTIFTSDGIVLDESATGHTGAGSWQITGPRSGAATFVYVYEGPDGNYRGNVIIRAVLDIDASGNTLTADYSYTAVAPDGTVLRSLEGKTHGVRVAVESVDAVGTPLAGFPTVESAPSTPSP